MDQRIEKTSQGGKTAFVFAGQGTQYPGMGREISQISREACSVFSRLEEKRPGTREQCFFGRAEDLNLTANTQPCLFAVEISIARALLAEGIKADGVSGFSLGEIPALTFSGAFDLEAGFDLVMKRGDYMQEAASKTQGGMGAVLKLKKDEVAALIKEAIALGEEALQVPREKPDLFLANFNSPLQTVVGGKKEALEDFSKMVKRAGGLFMPLLVSGAFHTPYMEEAAQKLAEALKSIPFQSPEIPIYSNVTGKPYPSWEKDQGAEARALICRQIKEPVQWQSLIETMVEDGFDTFIEVGPGKTLSGLIGKIAPGVRRYKVENAEDFNRVVTEVGNVC